MAIQVKICGINHPAAAEAAVAGGARYLGLVFYPRSPRAVTPLVAAELSRFAPTVTRVVGLFVDPTDDEIDRTLGQVPLDLIQLHGAETPARVAALRAQFRVPVMKAIKIANPADVAAAADYQEFADRLLFDAKPPAKVTALPGGNGLPFDWSLLSGRVWTRPWLLSGGLNVANLAEAVAITGASAVDVSSGVEDRPGHKCPALIHEFLALAATL